MIVTYYGRVTKERGRFWGSVSLGSGVVYKTRGTTAKEVIERIPKVLTNLFNYMHSRGEHLPVPEETEGATPFYVNVPDGADYADHI